MQDGPMWWYSIKTNLGTIYQFNEVLAEEKKKRYYEWNKLTFYIHNVRLFIIFTQFSHVQFTLNNKYLSDEFHIPTIK